VAEIGISTTTRTERKSLYISIKDTGQPFCLVFIEQRNDDDPKRLRR
jgi:hypothetical protein